MERSGEHFSQFHCSLFLTAHRNPKKQTNGRKEFKSATKIYSAPLEPFASRRLEGTLVHVARATRPPRPRRATPSPPCWPSTYQMTGHDWASLGVTGFEQPHRWASMTGRTGRDYV